VASRLFLEKALELSNKIKGVAEGSKK